VRKNNGRASIGEDGVQPGRRGRIGSRATRLGLVTAGALAVGVAMAVPASAATSSVPSASGATTGATAVSSAASANSSIFNPPTQANAFNESPQELTGVYAASPTDVWAVGNVTGDPFEHWNGTSWTGQGLPAGIATFGNSQVNVNFITGTSADNITAVGNGIIDTGTSDPEESVAFHFNGTSWSNITLPAKVALGPVLAFSATNLWSVNDNGDAEHFNGKTWKKTKLPIPKTEGNLGMTSISGSSPSDIWAAGFVQTSPGLHGHNAAPVLEHFNGTKWTNVTVPVANPTGGLSDVVAITSSDAYLVSQEGILHWNGSTWAMLNATTQTGAAVTGVVAALSPTDVWVGNGTTLDNFNGTTWTSVPVPSTVGLTPAGQMLAAPDAAAAVGPGSVWFVGETFTAAGNAGFPYAVGTSNG
jgi:hypothetical protein